MLPRGGIAQLAADSYYAVLVLDNHFAFGSLNFAGWMLRLVFIGTAALHPSMARLASPVTAAPSAAFRPRLVLLCGASLIPLALIVINQREARADQTPVLVGFSAALFIFVMVRMAGLMGRIVDHRSALQHEVTVRERRKLGCVRRRPTSPAPMGSWSSSPTSPRTISRNRCVLEAANATARRPYSLSVSVGIGIYEPERPVSLEALMQQADGAMYAQKSARRQKAS